MVQERCLPSLQAVWKLMQHFVLMPHDVYEEIMRLCWVLIEWDDDIDMKSLWPSYSSHTDASACLVGQLTCIAFVSNC